MDYEAIRAGMAQMVPFNAHVGLEVADVGPGRGVVRLPDDPRLHNPRRLPARGGAVRGGRAASGGAFIGAFASISAT